MKNQAKQLGDIFTSERTPDLENRELTREILKQNERILEMNKRLLFFLTCPVGRFVTNPEKAEETGRDLRGTWVTEPIDPEFDDASKRVDAMLRAGTKIFVDKAKERRAEELAEKAGFKESTGRAFMKRFRDGSKGK